MSGARERPTLGQGFVGREVEAVLRSGEVVHGRLAGIDGEANCLIRGASVGGVPAGEVLVNGAQLDLLYPLGPAPGAAL